LFGGITGIFYGIGTYFAHECGSLPSEVYEKFCFGDGAEISNASLSLTILGACLKNYRKNGLYS